MTEPTKGDLLLAASVNFDHADRARHVAQLISDVRAEERERGEAERALLAASLKQADAKLADLKSVNRYQRGYSDGQKDATRRLVEEVDGWMREQPYATPGLHAILNKYDPKPEGA